MRFGICASADRCATLAALGYDYIELSAAADLMPDAGDSEWRSMRAKLDAMPLRPEAFNSFVRTGKIIGPQREADRLVKYVNTALARASSVGGRVIVFGSGGARNVPQGMPVEEARRQLGQFLEWCADASDATGVTVVIEPLRRAESNLINRVSEGAEIARSVARKGVRNLADTYHMEMEQEPLSAIPESADVLFHVHTADSGRLPPGTGTYDHAALFRALRAARYEGSLSIECDWPGDFAEQVAASLVHLRKAASSPQVPGIEII